MRSWDKTLSTSAEENRKSCEFEKEKKKKKTGSRGRKLAQHASSKNLILFLLNPWLTSPLEASAISDFVPSTLDIFRGIRAREIRGMYFLIVNGEGKKENL